MTGELPGDAARTAEAMAEALAGDDPVKRAAVAAGRLLPSLRHSAFSGD